MRRRNSTAGEVSHMLINYSGPSFLYLPRDILVNILLRLSIKRIFVCKGVCKTWNDLISDPEFAKFHSEQAQVYPLIRTSDLSRILYLVQPEKDDFELKLDMCDHTHSNSECVCHVKVELDTKFELSKCNHMIHDDEDSSNNMLDHDSGAETNKCMKLDIKVEKYSIVNSCNGLLCLSDPSDNDPLIVCNPITGEFMKLPEAKKVEDLGFNHNFGFAHGFGFSPATNEYKAIRILQCGIKTDTYAMRGIVTEVHILGTELWKNIGFFVAFICESVPPIYSNGFLYFFDSAAIMGFDIEKERFVKVATPPLRNYKKVGMGVLGGELCMSGIDEDGSRSVAISVWVFKDCGAKMEWSKLFSIELHSRLGRLDGPYQPVKYLNDGALLMFQPYNNAFIYKDPRKLGFRYLKVSGLESTWWSKSKVEVIAHIPSFVSLKHALSLSGQNVKVLNVKSRCAELGKAISIVEQGEVEKKLEYWGPSSESEDGDLESESDSEDRVLESNSEYRKKTIVEGEVEKKLEYWGPSAESEDRDLESDSEDGDLESESDSKDRVLESNSEYRKETIVEGEVEKKLEYWGPSAESEDTDLESESDSEDRVLESNSEDRKILRIGMKLTAMGLFGGALLGLCRWYLGRKTSGR